MANNIKAYLAGPGVFLENAQEYFEEKKKICQVYGVDGISPFDSDVEYNNRPKIEKGLAFSISNEKIMENCHIMIADCTPFRGPSIDPGTAFEIGFMRAKNKKVFGYSNIKSDFYERTKRGFAKVGANGVNEDKDSFNMSFENFGMMENLMIHGSIIRCGGAMFVGDVPVDERFTNLTYFEQVLEFIRKQGI